MFLFPGLRSAPERFRLVQGLDEYHFEEELQQGLSHLGLVMSDSSMKHRELQFDGFLQTVARSEKPSSAYHLVVNLRGLSLVGCHIE